MSTLDVLGVISWRDDGIVVNSSKKQVCDYVDPCCDNFQRVSNCFDFY
jgi:hypothetical protein